MAVGNLKISLKFTLLKINDVGKMLHKLQACNYFAVL